jgi:predicted dehydrogenase
VEGFRQTWVKTRVRATLTRWDAREGAFAAVGVVIAGPPEGPAPGTPVLCWSWQGPVDADLHLVAREQCLPVPRLAAEYALAPLLGWIASVLRRVQPGIAGCRLPGIDQRLAAPLAAMLGAPRAAGRRVVVGFGPMVNGSKAGDELAVRLSHARAVDPLVTESEIGWTCRLPDPAHFFLDPYYPGVPELPEPFGRAAVEEALAALVRHVPAGAAPEAPARPVAPRTLSVSLSRSRSPRAIRVSCLGAGNYVRALLLHHLRRSAPIHVRGVMDIRPEIAAVQARALAADFCTTDPAAVLEDRETDLVLVASDHASHAAYATAALSAGKAVHLEKPPVVSFEQLGQLLACLQEMECPPVQLGYNRPFAPAVTDLQRHLAPRDGPTSVTCVVSGYRLGRAHWYNWPDQGSRIAGNLVHWIDLGYRLVGRRPPVSVGVTLPTSPAALALDTLLLNAEFDEGSLLTISFSSAPDDTLGVRERIDVTRGDLRATIDDFRALRVRQGGRVSVHRYRWDKGHAAAMAALARRVRSGEWDPRTTVDLARTSAIQLTAQALLAEGGGWSRVEDVPIGEGVLTGQER